MSSPVSWQVYVQDWVVVYTSDDYGKPGHDEAARVFKERWEGRVEEGDVLWRQVGGWTQILLRLHVTQGQWKQREDADAHADRLKLTPRIIPASHARLHGFPQVVGTGTPEERELLDYGKKKLRV